MEREESRHSGTSPTLDPLVLPSLINLAYRSIKASVLTGRVQMGDRLSERNLAEQLQISRGTVRAALRRLADEGITVDRPRVGTFVRELGLADIIDVYNVDTGIQTTAARLIVARRPSLVVLEQITDQMEAAEREGDLAAVSEAEYDFHETLVALSGNEHLLDVFRFIAGRIRLALTLDINMDYSGIAKRHVPVIEALRSGSEGVAVQVIHSHITGHLTAVLRSQGLDTENLLEPL